MPSPPDRATQWLRRGLFSAVRRDIGRKAIVNFLRQYVFEMDRCLQSPKSRWKNDLARQPRRNKSARPRCHPNRPILGPTHRLASFPQVPCGNRPSFRSIARKFGQVAVRLAVGQSSGRVNFRFSLFGAPSTDGVEILQRQPIRIDLTVAARTLRISRSALLEPAAPFR